MIKKYFGKIIIFTFVGFIFGVLMLIIGLNTETITIVRKIFDFIHKPAGWLAEFWSYKLRLPPQNEAAFAIVPMVACVFQWTFLGFLFGLWTKKKGA